LEIIEHKIRNNSSDSIGALVIDEPSFKSLLTETETAEIKQIFDIDAKNRLEVAIIKAKNGDGLLGDIIKGLKIARFFNG